MQFTRGSKASPFVLREDDRRARQERNVCDGLRLRNPFDPRANRLQLFFKAFIPAIQMVDSLDPGSVVRNQRREHQIALSEMPVSVAGGAIEPRRLYYGRADRVDSR